MKTKVTRSDEEWKAMLDPMEYQVTRHAATERIHRSLLGPSRARDLFLRLLRHGPV